MNRLINGYRDALALTRAAINGDHDLAAQMISQLTDVETRVTLSAATALAAVLTEQLSADMKMHASELIRQLAYGPEL